MILDLAPFLLTPGARVVVRRAESMRARAAHAAAAVRRLREAREMMGGRG